MNLRGWIMRYWNRHSDPDPEEPVEAPDIPPERLDRINRVMEEAERTLAAAASVRHAQTQTTGRLIVARQMATGVIGADLLADREGRYPSGPAT